MVIESAQMRREIELRTRAATQLGGDDMQRQARLSSTAALRVLHALASSPATAADAIALLHELQVHQVELDLQYEELQGSNSELEASLDRQARLGRPWWCAYSRCDGTRRRWRQGRGEGSLVAGGGPIGARNWGQSGDLFFVRKGR